MELMSVWMLVGLVLATYSVTANDLPAQILGTWISSNRDRVKWYWMWGTVSVVFLGTLWYGWYVNQGDISFGRLDKIPYIGPQWYHALAPLILVVLTVFGIPVSTSFLVLSAFASGIVMQKVLMKSVIGYAFAAVLAYGVWIVISKLLDETEDVPEEQKQFWYIAQWSATMLLLYTWLTHDIANFAVFMPRIVSADIMIFLSVLIVAGLGWMQYNQGGRIQQIVKVKKHTKYVRSATFIDLFYFLVLLFFKEYQIFGKIPMSTTWVFVGMLCGRELAIASMSQGAYRIKNVFPIIGKDFLKMIVGLAASVLIVVAIQGGFN